MQFSARNGHPGIFPKPVIHQSESYLRVWNASNPLTTLKTIPVNGFADLCNSNSATGFNLSF